MSRIKHRKYGRERRAGVIGGPTTHIIKMGWNTADKGQNKRPVKFPGFLICRDSIGTDGKPIIDYDAMLKLGFSKEQIEAALKDHFKTEGTLPTVLHFVLMANGEWDSEAQAWNYPAIVQEAFECYNDKGRFCWGDGNTAERKKGDGSTVVIPHCNPVGKTGVEAKDYCEFSTSKKCSGHLQIMVCLCKDDKGELKPLIPELGMAARARLDTHSGYAPGAIFEQLDAAADRLTIDERDGNPKKIALLSGITGKLLFNRASRRKGDGGSVEVGNLTLVLDEEAIIAREAWIRAERDKRINYRIEAGKAGVTLQLEAPTAPDSIIDIDPEGEQSEETPAPQPEPLKPEQTIELEKQPAKAAPPAAQEKPKPEPVTAEIVDDDPLGLGPLPADPEPQKPAPPTIDTIDPDYLVAALGIYCDMIAESTLTESVTVLRDLFKRAAPNLAGYAPHINGPEFFTDASISEEKRAGRVKLLRDICRKLDAEKTSGFKINHPEMEPARS